jgi:tripeptide aminopeptidase
LVIGAPSQRSYTAVFTGKAAHAGINPEEGNSAIRAAALAVAALPLGRLDDATTTNIGTITGGSANNIVAAQCTITGECRSHDPERLRALCLQIDATLAEAAASSGTALSLDWVENYEGFSYELDDPLITGACEISRMIGLEPEATVTGGGADTNIFVRRGLRAVSLATGMQDVHGTSETLAVRDLEDLSSYLIALIMYGLC